MWVNLIWAFLVLSALVAFVNSIISIIGALRKDSSLKGIGLWVLIASIGLVLLIGGGKHFYNNLTHSEKDDDIQAIPFQPDTSLTEGKQPNQKNELELTEMEISENLLSHVSEDETIKSFKVLVSVNLDREGAKLYLDGQLRGTVTDSFDIVEGQHELKFVYQDPYDNTWIRVDTIYLK